MDSNSPTLLLRIAETLREVAEYLADLPQRRKALLYVSVGMPIDIGDVQAAVPGAAGMDKSGIAASIIGKVRDAILAAANEFLARHGILIVQRDVGGVGGRKVIFTPAAGKAAGRRA